MQIDDRLSTVLRNRADSETAARTQLRQLLDLLGSADQPLSATLAEHARARLSELAELTTQGDLARIVCDPGIRLRNRALVEMLAGLGPRVTASVMARARLEDDEWDALIPRLPIMARGFLRHRKDLPPSAKRQLEQLGVGDLVLANTDNSERATELETDTQADGTSATNAAPHNENEAFADHAGTKLPTADIGTQPASTTALNPAPGDTGSVASLLHRIESFRANRRAPADAPRLPLGDVSPGETRGIIRRVEFRCNGAGVVTWASAEIAPWLVGMMLTGPRGGQLVRFATAQTARLLARHAPLRQAAISIDAALPVSGRWLCDAAPVFNRVTGAFEGYHGSLRREADQPNPAAQDSVADHTRQLLHELRTPVNAIQGFAEIIQQQLFGPVPHEYRAHAAAIAVDAAKLLAGFDEIDRLTMLESKDVALQEGEADFNQAVNDTVRRLEAALKARGAAFAFSGQGAALPTQMSQEALAQLIWRILATVAGALGPGETLAIAQSAGEGTVQLVIGWPATLRERLEGGHRDGARKPVVSSGIFHPRFAMRLARAEARAAGGKLSLGTEQIILTLPRSNRSGTSKANEAEQVEIAD